MFTGIIETSGTVRDCHYEKSNLLLYIDSAISSSLQIDQSVAHDGVCLTVDQTGENWHRCTLIKETISRTHFSEIKKDDKINLERSVKSDSRIDGHFVQGHVDTIAECLLIKDENGSWVYSFSLPDGFKALVVNKGSVCVNGVSLTISDLQRDRFEVSIIPYTFDHTNFNQLRVGSKVNIEFDILGKYIQRLLSLRGVDYLGL